MNFGNCFREYRKLNNLTQRQLAEKLGIKQSNISDWENNVSRPEYENLINLANLYQITIEELLGIDNILNKRWD